MENRSNSSLGQRETYDIRPESSKNTQERKAISYLERKRIHDIVDFLLGELLVRRPYDPYEYMIQLLDKRILARDGLVDFPSPFCSRDIIRQAKQTRQKREVELPTVSESTTNERQTRKFLTEKRCLCSNFKSTPYK
ncbi:uncharacterized protein LOC105839553 [Monomorium pharaonis]|uniref:uncharacterized protein LOC105839553 n=1 Tax=Monomorium pharaonis TaxID=307658 RepID=UPI001745FCE9|nr:uncharacterized protein LOC105839553 [Monomorium pharaonis]XP_012541401.2 uncharacterized protein LOC105839553 [Monomorium pharaonis]XP_036149314.1 uncharacterized protein LOC105839553 [Monomorium pharaonis]